MKKFKSVSYALILTLGLTTLCGCGKKKEVSQESMVDKYAAMCELGEYKGIQFEETKTEVTDDMLDYQINSLLSNYSTSEQVTSGKAEMGDTVNIDFVGSVDGVEFNGGNTQGAGTDLTLGSGSYIDDFEDQIVGHEVGETFDVNVTFPENYGKEELNGKDAVFVVTINYIKKTTTPEYTDEFIASNTDASSIKEYEEGLMNDMVEYYAKSDLSSNRAAVMTIVVDNATIKEYPEKESKELIDKTIDSVEAEADSYGYSLADYVVARYGFSDESDFEQYVSDTVEDYLKEKIVVCAIAKAENIEVSDDEIAAKKAEMLENTGMEEDEFKKYYTDEDVLYYALADKVADFLIENGKGVQTVNETEDVATPEDATPVDATKEDE